MVAVTIPFYVGTGHVKHLYYGASGPATAAYVGTNRVFPPAVYATWNPADKATYTTLSNGNLTATCIVDGENGARATIGKSSGKWYWEIHRTNASASNFTIGVVGLDWIITSSSEIGNRATGYGYNANYSGSAWHAGSLGHFSGASGYYSGDIVSVVLDLDAGTLNFWLNGVDQGQFFTGIAGTFYPAYCASYSGDVITANFGASAFAYSPPGGFVGLSGVSDPTYVTLNPADKDAGVTLSNGNLTAHGNGSTTKCRATIGKSSGKWYWEVSLYAPNGGNTSNQVLGIATSTENLSYQNLGYVGSYGFYDCYDQLRHNSGWTGAAITYFKWTDTVGFSLDMDNNTLDCYQAGVSILHVTGIAAGTWFPTFDGQDTSPQTFNFGASAFANFIPAGYRAYNP